MNTKQYCGYTKLVLAMVPAGLNPSPHASFLSAGTTQKFFSRKMRLIPVKILLLWYQCEVFLLRTLEPNSNLGGPRFVTFI
jgi:hypothetical protein